MGGDDSSVGHDMGVVRAYKKQRTMIFNKEQEPGRSPKKRVLGSASRRKVSKVCDMRYASGMKRI